ncbi:MAG: zincin-like metallopeptidase domain-containing protein [Candidatus Solibacter sp.]
MSTNENTVQKSDVYQKVTDAIINAIEIGVGHYHMPWTIRQDKGFSPISVGSGKPYRGINTLVLWAQAQSKGYGSAFWGTYQQWQELGGQVRKGERGSPVVYWGTYEKRGANIEDSESNRGLFAKGYTTFNIEQVDGCKLPKRFDPKLSQNERIAIADAFFAGVGVQIREGGNRAFYRPDTPEAVYMPGFDQFPDPVNYYSVLAHESTHWTSHDSRCDRQLGKRFGDAAYAMEELIAELGSAYTMARLELELTPREDHAQYLQSWLDVLKADKRAIFTAASKAQQAADFLVQQAGRLAEVAA